MSDFFDDIFDKPLSSGNISLDLPSLNSNEKCPLSFTDDILEYAESKEYLGFNLFPKQRFILEEFYTQTESKEELIRKYNTMILIAGMRGSKSATASIIGTFEVHKLLALTNPQEYYKLLPGQRIYLINIANAKKQSSETIFAAMDSTFKTNSWWRKYIEWLKRREINEISFRVSDLFHKTETSYEFRNKQIYVTSEQSNSSSLAGRTLKLFLSDEISRADVSEDEVQAKTQKRSAQAIFNTLSRGTKTFKKEGLTVVVSSPMFEDDYGMQLLCKCKKLHLGNNGKERILTIAQKYKKERLDTYLGFHYATYEMNPNITREDLLPERTSNPEVYRRDFEALPPSSVSPFFEYPSKVDFCVSDRQPVAIFEDILMPESSRNTLGEIETRNYIGKKLISVSPDRMNFYFISCDPGETKDSFTLCMGHPEEVTIDVYNKEGKIVKAQRLKTVIDLLLEWIPNKQEKITVNFKNVEQIIEALAENFIIQKVTYDRWQSSRSLQELFSQGIQAELLGISTPIYEIFRNRVYGNLIDFLPNEDLIDQIKKLQRIRTKVDHAPGMKKDLADAVARVDFLIHTYELENLLSGNTMMPVGISFAPGAGEKTKMVKALYSNVKQMNSPNFGSIWSRNSRGNDFFGKC